MIKNAVTKSAATKVVGRDDDVQSDDDDDNSGVGVGAKIGTFIVSVSRPLSIPSSVHSLQSLAYNHGHNSQFATAMTIRNGNHQKVSHCYHHGRQHYPTATTTIKKVVNDVRYLEYISELDVEMSWGRGMVYIQQVSRQK